MSNQEKPLVSVAIVTFNQKNYLKECIETCLAQDYDNIEIVVADDGSNDGTHELMKEYSLNYPGKFVLQLSKINRGITKNSNAAIFSCTGKYIAIMGGDDLMLPDKISKQVEYMENNPTCDVCYHDMDVFDSETNRTIHLYSRKNNSISGNIKTIIKYGTVNCASSTMYRSEKIPTFGFRDELPVASDWMLTIDVLSKGGGIKYIPLILGRYRRHMKNVTGIESPIRVQGARDMIRTVSICLEEYPEFSDDAIFRLSAILRESRMVSASKYYSQRLRASIRAGGGIKSLLGLMVFKASGGRLVL